MTRGRPELAGSIPALERFAFLPTGGATGALLRSIDWSTHPLGASEGWPAALKVTLGILLGSRHPMFLWWGPELFQFYNDAYLPSFGAGKHPAAMGQRGADCWQEILPLIWPQIDDVMRLGKASWNEDQLVPISRNGRVEEVYWTYGYSPVLDEAGAVGGTLVVCTETTARVLAERRQRSLRELADTAAAALDSDAVIDAALRALSGNPGDVTFALWVHPDPATGQLETASGAPLAEPARSALLGQLRESDAARVIELPPGCPAGLWPEPTRLAFVSLIDEENRARGFQVIGLSPRLPFDAAYHDYLAQVAEQVAQAQVRIEAFLARSRVEAERRNLLAQAPVPAALLTGPEHRFEVANSLYCQMVGRREVVGKTFLEALPELQGTPTPDILDRVYRTGIPFVTNESLVPLDRNGKGVVENAWFKFNLEPMRDAQGGVYGMMAIAVDITEQVQARHGAEELAARLRESEERLRLVVEASGTGTWEMAMSDQSVNANARFRELFGLSSDEPLTLDRCLSAVHPDDVSRVAQAFSAAMGGSNAGRYDDTYRIRTAPDERPRWVESRGQLRFGPDGKAARLHGTVVDITARKAEEAQVLQRADFEQQLIGMVSHDLRNPLSAILLSADILARFESLDDRCARSVLRIRSSADRANRMIRDLLDFTQARLGGGIRLDPRPIDLRELVRGVIDEVEAAHPGREIVVRHQGSERGAWDGDRIAQVIQNLLVNALKYSPPQRPVQLSTWTEPGWVLLSVQNGGPPIPAGKLPRIFEPLQRAVAEVDFSTRSVGLGLYIVRHIVDAHRGSIAVESTDEAGTTFTLRLPRD